MKCPSCSAELLPVDGEMFCLQCGRIARLAPGVDGHGPPLEATTDPVLQRAIQDVADHPVEFRVAPTSVAAAPKPKPVPRSSVKSFASLGRLFAAPRPALAGAGGAGALALPVIAGGVTASASRGQLAVPAPGSVVAPVGMAAKLQPVLSGARARSILASPAMAWVGAVLAVVVALNVGIAALYANRVYPGVHVGQLSVGGLSYDQVATTLGRQLKPLKLSVTAGGSVYPVPTSNFGAVDVAKAAAQAQEVGRTQPLPLMALAAAWMSRPVGVSYGGSDGATTQLVANLAAKIDHVPAPAVPMIVNGQAFVISEKSGQQLDRGKAAAALKAALANESTQVTLPVNQIDPVVQASNYRDDITAAQARMALSLKVTVKTASYSPTAVQIGSWLVFKGAGKGVGVDGSQVADYVSALPGRFDRTGTVTALLAAVTGAQNANYVASTRKVTATPPEAATGATLPMQSYHYCFSSDGGQASQQALSVADALNAPAGWGLGGRLAFAQSSAGCNFGVQLVSAAGMGRLDPACAKQTTCTVGDQIEIATESWAKAPASWTGGLVSYQGELVNHEVGHWLGFTHAACPVKPADTPILQVPTVSVAGCSPNWYAIDPSMQDAKVLPGF